jgi:hypothetical protein
MARQIQITAITGTPTYDIYVCDITNTYCFFVSGFTSTIPPNFVFTVPPPLEGVESLLLKIIDSNGCEKFILLVCEDQVEKQFQDLDLFYFQDIEIYKFQ